MKRTLVWGWVVAAIFCASLTPSFAHTSSDWDEVEAQIKALPPGFGSGAVGSIPQEVLDEIHQKIGPLPNTPKTLTAVTDTPGYWTLDMRPDGLLQNSVVKTEVHDPARLLEILGVDIKKVYSLTLSAPLSALLASGANLSLHAKLLDIHFLDHDVDGFTDDVAKGNVMVSVEDYICTLASATEDKVTSNCTRIHHWSYGNADISYDTEDADGEKPHTDPTQSVAFNLDRRFDIYWPEKKPALFLDWKTDGQQWHSQIVAGQITAAQKNEAQSLFARGFDLYKSGDFVGAITLIEAGLKIDPSNHLGWFTLAEIGRSAKDAHPNSDWPGKAQAAYYQHTIDLAPDSPEAALAKGYLDALR